MDKLQMAHEWAMKHGSEWIFDTVPRAWEYADAMQAEADKRKPSGLPEALQEDLPYYEVGRSYPPDAYVMYEGKKTLAVSIGKEWQPDWSQAPEWANWWAIAECGQAWWSNKLMFVRADGWGNSEFGFQSDKAPSFNYQGNWQDSLRKRPQ